MSVWEKCDKERGQSIEKTSELRQRLTEQKS